MLDLEVVLASIFEKLSVMMWFAKLFYPCSKGVHSLGYYPTCNLNDSFVLTLSWGSQFLISPPARLSNILLKGGTEMHQ